MRLIIKKIISNNIVNVVTGLPNLGINLSTQFVLDVIFKWTGFYALLAYLIGTFLSVQYSVIWGMLTKTSFKVGKHEYHYSHKHQPEKPKEKAQSGQAA